MTSPPRSEPDLGPIDMVWRRGGEEYLPLRLILVAKLLDLNVARLLAGSAKISVAEWRVVAQLGVLHHASVREMARQACIDPAEVSRSVGSLERRGFVVRRPNPRDRRSPRFSLTDSGARHLASFRPHWKRFQRMLVAKLSHRDRGATERALTLIARASLDLLEQQHSGGRHQSRAFGKPSSKSGTAARIALHAPRRAPDKLAPRPRVGV